MKTTVLVAFTSLKALNFSLYNLFKSLLDLFSAILPTRTVKKRFLLQNHDSAVSLFHLNWI